MEIEKMYLVIFFEALIILGGINYCEVNRAEPQHVIVIEAAVVRDSVEFTCTHCGWKHKLEIKN